MSRGDVIGALKLGVFIGVIYGLLIVSHVGRSAP